MLSDLVKKEIMFIKTAASLLLLTSMAAFLTGCLAVRSPVDLNYAGSEAVESLSSNVSLDYKNSERSISGSGYIVYKRPDQMRATILSPFGSVLQEIFLSGESVTIIDTGNGLAFSGKYADLPVKGDFSGWRYFKWLIDIDLPSPNLGNSVIERKNQYGLPEEAVFENGMLISKKSAAGGKVEYGSYTTVQGVTFPLRISYETVVGEKFTILFDDPEINVKTEDGVFTPNLNKLNVYPLSILK